MKRYYVCDLIGDGSEENPFRPAVADFPVSWAGSIVTGDDGRPVHGDCLVIVNTEDHSTLRNAARVTPLPDFPLDGKVSAIQNGTKNAMLSALTARGFDTTAIGNADGYRDALIEIGRQRDPAFNVDKFDVR